MRAPGRRGLRRTRIGKDSAAVRSRGDGVVDGLDVLAARLRRRALPRPRGSELAVGPTPVTATRRSLPSTRASRRRRPRSKYECAWRRRSPLDAGSAREFGRTRCRARAGRPGAIAARKSSTGSIRSPPVAGRADPCAERDQRSAEVAALRVAAGGRRRGCRRPSRCRPHLDVGEMDARSRQAARRDERQGPTTGIAAPIMTRSPSTRDPVEPAAVKHQRARRPEPAGGELGQQDRAAAEDGDPSPSPNSDAASSAEVGTSTSAVMAGF